MYRKTGRTIACRPRLRYHGAYRKRLTNMTKTFVFLGAVNALLAVALGAFGAHGLSGRLTEPLLAAYLTGVDYHSTHALGLILVGLLAHWRPGSAYWRWGGWLLFAGIVLFSGSLYALALSGVRALGAITPFGGTAFILGWLVIAVGALRQR